MNIIRNIEEFLERDDYENTSHRSSQEIIEEFQTHYPENSILIEYKDFGFCIFDFQYRTKSGIHVYDSNSSVS
jgi:hypothetical protein